MPIYYEKTISAGRFHRMKVPFFYGWIVVAVAALGLLLGTFPIFTFSFGVFFPFYVQDFHADRAAISLAFTIQNSIVAFVAVFIGTLADRFGARNLIVCGLGVVGCTMTSALAIGRNLWQLYLFYAVLAALGGATNSVPYSLVVSRWFNRQRGLALGLMMTGLGLGAVVIPIVAERLIQRYGWRLTFAIMGGAMVLIALPAVALFLKDSPQCVGLLPDGVSSPQPDRAADPAQGVPWRQIRQSRTFWLMVAAFMLVGASTHACIIHLPELIRDRGASAHAGAAATSVVGVAVLVGRVGTGYFLDRLFGPYVALSVFAGSACGIALLSMQNGTVAIAGAFLVGLAFGGEVDMIAYLMSRYFGLRSLGTAFGFGFGAFVLAGGLGPLIMGFAFDRTASYNSALGGFIAASLLAAFLMGRLGPYRFTPMQEG